jgi:hypothetical protein
LKPNVNTNTGRLKFPLSDAARHLKEAELDRHGKTFKPIVPRGACIYCFLDYGKRSDCHQYFTPSGNAKAMF